MSGLAKFGSEFLVNTTTAGVQDEPAITGLANGRFVVTWTDASHSGGDTSGLAVRGQVFTAEGQPAGRQCQEETFTVIWRSGNQPASQRNRELPAEVEFSRCGSRCGSEFAGRFANDFLRDRVTIVRGLQHDIGVRHGGAGERGDGRQRVVVEAHGGTTIPRHVQSVA